MLHIIYGYLHAELSNFRRQIKRDRTFSPYRIQHLHSSRSKCYTFRVIQRAETEQTEQAEWYTHVPLLLFERSIVISRSRNSTRYIRGFHPAGSMREFETFSTYRRIGGKSFPAGLLISLTAESSSSFAREWNLFHKILKRIKTFRYYFTSLHRVIEKFICNKLIIFYNIFLNKYKNAFKILEPLS